MRRELVCRIFILIFLCTPMIASANIKEANEVVEPLLKKMSLDEKIGQLVQYTADMAVTGPSLRSSFKEDIAKGRVGSIFNAYTPEFTRELQKLAIEKTRLKIPLLFGFDVIHGHRTIFPIPLAESASWDLELIEKTARVSAQEAAADGIHWVFAPMVDVSRDPRWGRVSEGAGEDTWLGSKVAAARVRGLQGRDLKSAETVLACVKHYAAYGAPEGGRDYNTVDMSRRELFETYLPPFQAAVDASVGSLMTAFNEISGVPSTANTWLIKDVLRKQWGFNGLVVSDYTSINELVPHGVAENLSEAGRLAFQASVDMDMQGAVYAKYLKALIKKGQITESQLNEAVRRVLFAKYQLGLFEDPYRYSDPERAKSVLMSKKSLEHAREAARRSIVLLKNKSQVLPLKKRGTIALIGPMVKNQRDQIGNWSAAGDWKKAVNLWDGVTEAVGDRAKVAYALGSPLLSDQKLIEFLNQHDGQIEVPSQSVDQLRKEAVALGKKADVIVLALGETQGMSGEAASRTQIELPKPQQELLRELQKTGKPIVLLVYSGRPLVLTAENSAADAILLTWFLGSQSGHAIADILFGDYSPSGKLPMTFPAHQGQIPIYYSHKKTGRPFDAKNKYTSKYLDAPNEPLYPFGWGLSYTEFEYSRPKLSSSRLKRNGVLKISVQVKNAGSVAGEETVQLYIRDLVASVTRPVRELRGFQKINLKKGERKTVRFEISPADLSFINQNLKRVTEPGEFEVSVGGNSRDVQTARFRLEK